MREKRIPANAKLTKGKKIELKRGEEGRLNAAVIDAMPDGLILVDTDGNVTSVNPVFEKMTGYEGSELVGKDAVDVAQKLIKSKEDLEKAMRSFGIALEEKVPPPQTHTLVTKDGREVSVISTLSFLKDAEGKPSIMIVVFKDVTKQKKMEEAVQASETEKKTILDAFPDIVLFQSTDLSIKWGNKAARRSVGKTQQELVGCHCYELLRGQSEPCEGCPVLRAIETRSVNKSIMTAPDGRYLEVIGKPVLDRGGKLIGAIEIARDITERKIAEEMLRESKERYRDLFENARDTIITGDLKGNITSVNKVAEEYGFKKDEIIGKNMLKFIPKEYWPKVLKDITEIARGGYSEREIEIITPKGKIFTEYRSNPIRRGKKVVGFQTIMRDITERKRAEEGLRRLSSVVDAMIDGVTVTDLHGKVTHINRAVIEQLGYEKEELIGKLPTEFIAEKDRPKFAAEAKKVLFDKSVSKSSEYLAKRKDGTEIPMSVNFSVLRDPKGRPREIIAVSRDITERKRAEEKVRTLAAIVNEAKVPIAMVSMDGIVTTWNKSCEEMLGYSAEETIGKIPMSKICPRAYEQIQTTIRGSRCIDGELEYVAKDGRVIPCSTSTFLVKDETGTPIGVCGIAMDITERKKAEEERLKAAADKQRIEELEKFAKVAVGRELKMIEQKERIKELELTLKEKS